MTLPMKAPTLDNTFTPLTQAPPSATGSYDVLGTVVPAGEAEKLLQTEEGRVQLASENGAVEVTEDLIHLGRDAFYRETFGNEYFFTDVVGAINGPINLPEGAKPSESFEKGDPTPGEPGLNEVIKMPGFPRGSLFILDGLMANSPGMPLGSQLNGMSAYQNTLAPPPYKFAADAETLKHGATVFEKANCAQCHSGRYFTNHDVIPLEEVKTQPSQA